MSINRREAFAINESRELSLLKLVVERRCPLQEWYPAQTGQCWKGKGPGTRKGVKWKDGLSQREAEVTDAPGKAMGTESQLRSLEVGGAHTELDISKNRRSTGTQDRLSLDAEEQRWWPGLSGSSCSPPRKLVASQVKRHLRLGGRLDMGFLVALLEGWLVGFTEQRGTRVNKPLGRKLGAIAGYAEQTSPG